MATADHWFVDRKLSKVNVNGLIMQLEQIFGKSVVVFSDYSYLKILLNKFITSLSTINGFIRNQTQTMKIGPKSYFS